MALSDILQLIQQQQALEQRKEERHQDLALNLLTLEMKNLDRQLAREEKRYDQISGEIEASKKDFQDLTGQLYKAPEKDQSSGSVDVVNDIGNSVVGSLNQLLAETQEDTQSLRDTKADIGGQLREAKLVSDFYTGVGHDYSAGDPNVWDVEDFSDEALAEYMSQYPELVDVDQRAFFEGMKTRGSANLMQNISNLNTLMHQSKTAELSASMKQIDYDTKSENITVAQIEADIDNIDSGVHKIIGSHADNLSTTLFAPALQAVIEFSESKTTNQPEGDPDLETEQNTALQSIGSIVTNMDVPDENLRIGKVLVLSNSNYINSVKGYLKGSSDLNYVGYVNGLQEVQMYAEQARRALEDGTMSTEDYLMYKNGVERLVGTDLNTFNNDMNLLLQASDTVEDKGREIALAGMKESYIESEQRFDYNVPDDYSPSPILPVDNDIVLDSLNIISPSDSINFVQELPEYVSPTYVFNADTGIFDRIPIDTSNIDVDVPDTTGVAEDIFLEVPLKKGQTWSQWWQSWKDFGRAVTIGGVRVSSTIINTLDNLTSRKELTTYLEKLESSEAEKLPKELYKEWVELNQGK